MAKNTPGVLNPLSFPKVSLFRKTLYKQGLDAGYEPFIPEDWDEDESAPPAKKAKE